MQICPPRPPQLALAPLLSSLRADLAEAAAALTKRRELFVSVAEKAGWKVISSGGFYAYVEFPYKNKGSEQVAHALAIQCGVLTLPGCFFMPEAKGQDRWIRFAVANVEDETVALVGERLEMMNRIMGE
jgi:aspartate/methionine/tyrosine aminotransferase